MSEISPASFASSFDVPVLLLHGPDDTVVDMNQSEIMLDALHATHVAEIMMRIDKFNQAMTHLFDDGFLAGQFGLFLGRAGRRCFHFLELGFVAFLEAFAQFKASFCQRIRKLAGDGAVYYVNNLTDTIKCSDGNVSRILKNATEILNRDEGKNPYLVHEELQSIMQQYVGIVRTGDELQNGLGKLDIIKTYIEKVYAHASPQYNPGWNEALDLKNLIVTAEAVSRSALMREESRGAHTRLDFEGEQPEGINYNIIIKKTDTGMHTEKIERDNPPQQLADIAHASLEDLEGEIIGT